MNKIIFFALLTLPCCTLAQKKGFELNGKAGLYSGVKAYLFYGTQVDSTTLNEGSFSFKGSVGEPIAATLILDEARLGLPGLNNQNADFIRFYLDNEAMTISSRDSIRKAVISGSAINDESTAYTTFINANTKRSAALQATLAAMPAEKQKDPAVQATLERQMEEAREELRGTLATYIKTHPSSYFSLLAVSNLVFLKADAERTETLYKSLSAGLQAGVQGKKTADEIAMLKNTSVGATAPLFTQPDSSGTPVSLSGFKGKYVLIDFWASWCMPCRVENPDLVKAYRKYHSRGLEILGVSLDGEAQRRGWLDAIRKDSLTWTQVSDLKGSDNAAAQLYGIQSIPQNFLLDPNGKIVALSLRGKDLDKKLEEIFNK